MGAWRHRFRPRRTLYLALGHDEEVGGHAGAKNIAAWLEQRVGKDAFEFMWDEGLFVIDRVVPMHRGPVAMICVAEKGSLTLDLTVEATPGHSSTPPHETAIGILASAVSKLEKRPLRSVVAGAATNMFTHLVPGFPFPMRLLLSNMWLFGGLLRRVLAAKHKTATLVRTTTALTVFHAGSADNVVPGSAKAVVQHRVHPNDTLDEVEAYDRAVITTHGSRYPVLALCPFPRCLPTPTRHFPRSRLWSTWCTQKRGSHLGCLSPTRTVGGTGMWPGRYDGMLCCFLVVCVHCSRCGLR